MLLLGRAVVCRTVISEAITVIPGRPATVIPGRRRNRHSRATPTVIPGPQPSFPRKRESRTVMKRPARWRPTAAGFPLTRE